MPDQTFTSEHRERLASEFAGCVSTDVLITLWRASHSETFGEDLRAILEDVVRPELLTRR